MEKKDLVEGMRLYIYKLRVDGRYSTAKVLLIDINIGNYLQPTKPHE